MTAMQGPQPSSGAWRAWLLAVIAARTCWGLYLGFQPFDDTFITFRYAANLASGKGFVYNAGEHVLGTTSPLWTAILAAASAVGIPLATVAVVVALAADAAAALLLMQLLVRLELVRGVAFAGALLFACTFDYLSLARSGMETSVFVLLVIAALEAASRERTASACLYASLASLARPEGLILLAVLAAVCWLQPSPRRVIAGAAVVLVVLGAWTAFATGYFGSAVPQSLIAKQHQVAADPGLARFSWMNLRLFLTAGQFGGGIFERTYLQLNFMLSALAGWAAIVLLRASRQEAPVHRLRPLLLMGFPAALVVAQAASHAFTWFPWYYGPIYPFLGALAAIGLGELASPAHGQRRPWILGIGVATLVLGQLLAALLVKLPSRPDSVARGYLDVARDIPRAAPGAVAALEIGAVGWVTWPRPVIDLLGLVTPAALGRPPLATIKDRRPEFLVVRTDDAASLLAEARQDAWFTGTYSLLASVRDPGGSREFQVFRSHDAIAAGDGWRPSTTVSRRLPPGTAAR